MAASKFFNGSMAGSLRNRGGSWSKFDGGPFAGLFAGADRLARRPYADLGSSPRRPVPLCVIPAILRDMRIPEDVPKSEEMENLTGSDLNRTERSGYATAAAATGAVFSLTLV